MLAKELISQTILPLRTSDTANIALNWMDELRVSHLPIVNNEAFLGLISEKDIYDMENPEEPLGNFRLSQSRPYVFSSQHLFDVIRVMASMELTLVPVLDEQENYLGCITQTQLIRHFARASSFDQPGAIIVLEMNVTDYSLHEISRIVESNDAKIMSCCTRTFDESTKIEVTLKLNKLDISAVIQTFHRYEYYISASFSEEDNYDELIKERFDSLMQYLNV